jgi:hypothetical protein
MTVLGWYELPDDDRPPERIWLDDKALTAHFEAVSERYRHPGSSGGSDWETIPGQDFAQNELTAQYRS